MKKPGSLTYLRMLSKLVLAYQKNWRADDESKVELPAKEENKRAKDWEEIIWLAEEIRVALGGNPANPESVSGSESRPEVEDKS